MKYEPKIHHRRSIRLRGYDYSLPGAYYVTLCAFGKQCIFGQVIDDQMQENDCGKIVRQQWFESSQIRQNLDLDAFIVMPNHLHGILWIVGPNGIRPRVDLTPPGLSGARPRTNRVQQNSNAIRPNEPGRTPFGYKSHPRHAPAFTGSVGVRIQIRSYQPDSKAVERSARRRLARGLFRTRHSRRG